MRFRWVVIFGMLVMSLFFSGTALYLVYLFDYHRHPFIETSGIQMP